VRRLLLLAPAVLTAACATVQPQDHRGLHFSADLGVAGSSSEATLNGVSDKYSGTGAGYAVAVGGAVAPNLIIGGQVFGTSVASPEETVSGGGSGTLSNVTYGFTAVGPMIKYYFMPINLYVAATPAIGRISLSDDTGSANTKWGPALRLAVGKEWYVAPQWGLGVSGILGFGSNEVDVGGATATYKTVNGGVVFSVSFN
jgi:hypothetical protein